MATTRNIRRGIRVLWLILLLLPAARGMAEVTAYPPGAVDSPSSVLTTRIIGDDLEPIEVSWQPTSGGSAGGTILNSDGHLNGDGEPSILIHPETGLAMAVWAQNRLSGYDIVLSRFTAGSWTSPEVLVGSTADELDPFLLIDPADGTVHLVYWIHDAGPRVMHMQAPADLSDWSTAQQVSGFGEIAVRPSAVFMQGTLRVVYERHDLGYGSTPRQIALATKVGGGFTTESVGSTTEAAPNWPEVHFRKGRLWIEWFQGQDVMAWTVSGPGVWEALRFEAFSGTEDRVFHVRGRIEFQALQ